MPSLLFPSRLNIPFSLIIVRSRSMVRRLTDIASDIASDIHVGTLCQIIYIALIFNLIQHHTFRHVPTFIPTFAELFLSNPSLWFICILLIIKLIYNITPSETFRHLHRHLYRHLYRHLPNYFCRTRPYDLFVYYW